MKSTFEINVKFNSNKPLTKENQDAIISQIELSLTDPQIWTREGPEPADWELIGSYEITFTTR
jgi:hypothetical protein